MKVDPVFIFWFGVATTIMQGLASGTVHLTGLIPMDYIPVVTGWLGMFVFINMTILTALNGFSSAKTGVFAPPTTVPEAKAILEQAQKAA